MIDEELLKILACPACKQAVKLEKDRIICQNPNCRLRYPIRDGIPVMLIDEAEKAGGNL
ncbi:MAG: Trm112 family protein [Candidatus Omnitrophica bacterium]|nr:Trm112 family protein [Candidatus Omnitrophota bacterium]